jgi:hypothetical protein
MEIVVSYFSGDGGSSWRRVVVKIYEAMGTYGGMRCCQRAAVVLLARSQHPAGGAVGCAIGGGGTIRD